MIWFGWVLWHINQCRLFNAKSFLYIYIKYIGFGLVGFHGISAIVGYLIQIHFYKYILNTGWNDKIVVLKKTTLQLFLKTFLKYQFSQLDYVVELTYIQCSHLQPQSPPRYWSGTGSMPFPQAPAGARWILGGWRDQAGGHVGDVLDVWPNELVQLVQVGGGWGEVREGYKVGPLLLKPGLGLFGLVGRRRVHPGSATGHLIAPGDHHTLQHIQVHFGVDFQADFEDVRWHDWPSLETSPKTITVAGNFVFITLGTPLLFVAIQICILRVLAMVLLS